MTFQRPELRDMTISLVLSSPSLWLLLLLTMTMMTSLSSSSTRRRQLQGMPEAKGGRQWPLSADESWPSENDDEREEDFPARRRRPLRLVPPRNNTLVRLYLEAPETIRLEHERHRNNQDLEEFYQLIEDARQDRDETQGSTMDPGAPKTGDCYSCQFACGRAPLNRESNFRADYIVNGKPQTYGEWPSFAYLLIYWPDYRTNSMCGGVLISNKHVLTAAHCMFDPVSGSRQANPNDIEITLGDHRRTSIDKHEMKFRVADACVSKGYTTGNGANFTRYDFAVLTLKEKVNFTDYIQPACLPLDLPIITNGTESTCYVFGYGAYTFTRARMPLFPSVIQKLEMVTHSCEPYGFGRSDASRECWIHKGDRGDSCIGDSGGPVLCLDSQSRWTAVGLVSYGSPWCDGKGRAGWVGVYTRIPSLMPLIKEECGI